VTAQHAEAQRPSSDDSSGLRAKAVRGRRRFVWMLRSLTLLAHGLIFASAWASGLQFLAVIWLCVGAPLALSRLGLLFADRPRSRGLVFALELLFSHLLGALLSLPLLPVAALLSWALGSQAAPALAAAPLLAYGLGLGLAAYGVFIRRRWVLLREVEVLCPELPTALDGLRVAHLSDLHIGSYDGRARGLQWVRRTLETKPDLIAVTGDLVTSGTQFYAAAAEVLGELSAPHGVHVILGNHDQWDRELFRSELEARGVSLLDNSWTALNVARGGAATELIVAGLGDPYTQRADLAATLAQRPAAFTLLLAHYPSWASQAAGRNVGLVLSGHTHGGQVGVPWLSDRLNVASLLKHHSRGLFLYGDTWLHVTAGLGTSGPPIRLGVPPEIALLTLRRSAAPLGPSRAAATAEAT